MVRDAFARLGWDAWSADLQPSLTPGQHLTADCRSVLNQDWDLLIAHPPCTYLCSSGMHWTVRGLRDIKLTEDAIAFAESLWQAPVPLICIENPVGCLSTKSCLGQPSQVIQPYQFGEDASKATCLWLKGLARLIPTRLVEPRMVAGRPRWANQCDSGQNKLGPSPGRSLARAKTYAGIADAMANQWGREFFLM